MDEIKGIQKNLNIFNELKDLIKKENSVEEKIRLISIASYFATYNHTGLFADKFLENELIKIAQSIKTPLEKPEKNSYLHVATSVYEFGGHTRLIDRFIKNSSGKHSLILTKQDGNIPEWLKKTISDKNGKIMILEGTDIDKTQELRKIASSYEKIILHIHPFDTIPILAFGTQNFKSPVIFYNHADHVFWLGVSISDLVLDLSTEGQSLSKKRRGVKKSDILPVPVEYTQKATISKKEAREILNLPLNKHIILSIGTSDKFRPFGKYNFIEKAFEIIKEIPNTIILVVGVSIKEKNWKEAFDKSDKRIIPIGLVEKAKLQYYIKSADVYLESFPLTSSTATIEVLLEGVPSICVRTEEKSWDVIREISVPLNEVVSKIKEILEKKIFDTKIIDKIKNLHCKDSWTKTLNNILFKLSIKHNHNLSDFSTLIEFNQYDIYIYNLLNNENKLIYFRNFAKLNLKNKIKIFSIFSKHPKFKSNIKSLIYNKSIKDLNN